MAKRKLLWVGDAVASTGFAKCTHHILKTVSQHWDVAVLGLNYMGDPHEYDYPIYPAYPGGDAFGVKRIKSLVAAFRPDLTVIQNDPWNFKPYLDEIPNTPVVGIVAVDGLNCRGLPLNRLRHAIFWTEFGEREARAGGFQGTSSVIPLGVDLSVYRPSPFSKASTRLEAGLPEEIHDKFILGNVNRNQPRKRLDLTIAYFAEWVKNYDVRDAMLFLSVAPTGDNGYDVRQLSGYYGLSKRLILHEPIIGIGAPEEMLVRIYQSFDAQISTTQGEGWGLTTLEGMACGIPQVAPKWAALGEWALSAMYPVRCGTRECTPNMINVIGGVPDKDSFIDGLRCMYDEKIRAEHATKSLEVARDPRYRWENIGQQYVDVLDEVMRA